jgi:hypothetical protein
MPMPPVEGAIVLQDDFFLRRGRLFCIQGGSGDIFLIEVLSANSNHYDVSGK